MAETAWLDLPFMELTKENVGAEAARRGLPFRKLMELHYQQDHERAVHLSMYWRVAPGHPEKLFGKSRVGQFVGDIRKFLVGAKIRITMVTGEDPHGLDQMEELKKERQARDLQEQSSRQSSPTPSATDSSPLPRRPSPPVHRRTKTCLGRSRPLPPKATALFLLQKQPARRRS
jgi:hypothetical protein